MYCCIVITLLKQRYFLISAAVILGCAFPARVIISILPYSMHKLCNYIRRTNTKSVKKQIFVCRNHSEDIALQALTYPLSIYPF